AAFGASPRSFRAGRFGLSRVSLPLLHRLGYEVDSSVTPTIDWRAKIDGFAFDYTGASTQPYRAAADDPVRAGELSILEGPVTIHEPRLRQALPWLGARLRKRWLRPTWSRPAELEEVALTELERQCHRGTVVLNMMFHNVEVVKNASPYSMGRRGGEAILARV